MASLQQSILLDLTLLVCMHQKGWTVKKKKKKEGLDCESHYVRTDTHESC